MNKIRNNKGETLIESLVAFAILAVIMLGFPTLIVSVNKLNKAVKDHNMSYSIDGATKLNNVTVTIKDESSNTYTFTGVNGYSDNEEFYFYGYDDYGTTE